MRKLALICSICVLLPTPGFVAKARAEMPENQKFVHQWAIRSLKGPNKARQAKAISQAIIAESKRQGVDPLLTLAIIQSESGFNPNAKGNSGEIGLMQITPQTGEWIAKQIGSPWKGARSLKNVSTNIHLGTAYLSYIKRNYENDANRELAGTGRHRRLPESKMMSKAYIERVRQRYIDFYKKVASKQIQHLTPAEEPPTQETMSTTLDWFRDDKPLDDVLKADVKADVNPDGALPEEFSPTN